jgi:hypothetical protein
LNKSIGFSQVLLCRQLNFSRNEPNLPSSHSSSRINTVIILANILGLGPRLLPIKQLARDPGPSRVLRFIMHPLATRQLSGTRRRRSLLLKAISEEDT